MTKLSLKKLSHLLSFDNQEFFSKKSYLLFGSEKWVDYESNKVMGVKFKVVVYQDNTDYGDLSISNAGETLTVKVEGARDGYQGAPVPVRLINPRGTIYGDYRNQLSVTADAVEILKNED